MSPAPPPLKFNSAEWGQLSSGEVIDRRFHVFPLTQKDVLEYKKWMNDVPRTGALHSVGEVLYRDTHIAASSC